MTTSSRSHYITTNACLGGIFSFVICLVSILTEASAARQLHTGESTNIHAGPLLLLTISRHAASSGYRLIITPHQGLVWLFVSGIGIGGIAGYALSRYLDRFNRLDNHQT